MASINDLSLAKGLTAQVEDACAGLIQQLQQQQPHKD